jgi:hypothetical protein
MSNEAAQQSSLLTPTRIVAAIAFGVVVLGVAVFMAWLAAPQTVTLEIAQPAGKTVVCHAVVDGKAESYRAVAPVTYRFEAREFRYAVVGLDASPPADVTVLVRDPSGTGGVRTDAGVKGTYRAAWWGTQAQFEAMTPTHVAKMRSSAAAEPL